LSYSSIIASGQTSSSQRYDVLIAGGAVMGSSVALFLKRLAPACTVAVVEPDDRYELASTLRASGGARRLFSCPENIAMSNFSLGFISAVPDVGWKAGGYLFIVPPEGVDALKANYETQRQHGVRVELLDRPALQARFPSMHTADLAAGAHSLDDGWCDPHSLLQWLRREARSLGVAYLRDRVVGFEHNHASVQKAHLASGAPVVADYFVNAAGAWSKELCAMIGMPLPVEPLRRFEHYFESPNRVEPLPYVKDLARLAFRPEGRGYSGGLVKSDEPRGFNFDVDHDYFESVVWPALAHRFPAFEACRCVRTWSGLYEQSELDGNPVIGNWPGRAENFFVVSGFSGHGMMHAPAAGRAIAELIVHRRFETIDLLRFGYARVAANQPYAERGIL
jgi:glycine/D-amino acid oxidase-like deaminating enzyme